MALFQWTKEYSVSVMRFDTDHKKLFSLLNELNDAMAEGCGRFVVGRILQELANYARTHFAAEEAVMRRASYAGLEEHIGEHRALTAKVENYCAEYSASHTVLSIDVLYFLRDWLEQHILRTDRQYGEPLNRAGVH